MSYRAPVGDIAFWLRSVAGLDADLSAGHFGDLSDDVIDAVLAEAGRFANDEIAPLNWPGDRAGAQITESVVTMPPGWKALYKGWAEGGWPSLTGNPEHGGQGLPAMLHAATFEIWNGASLAFSLFPLLTAGAVEALEAHGTEAQKATYLHKMVSGTWSGTMNLTEPQAGSDLGALRTRAEPAGDGSYRIFGSKIYITYGETDLVENIIHLVLARLPDAPEGSRGISLFVVPKFLVEADGSLGARNDVKAVSLEHKLGIHASPTCVMQFGDAGGAIGWMVGEPNRGLAAMFTMMNNARLAVGLQGVGVAEAAYQKALAYALERRQGRAAGWTCEGMSPIVHHPDVKRMLLTMRALTDVSRALCYALAHAIDRGRLGPEAERAGYAARAALLTPVAKAFATDAAMTVASLGIQVHGGMGFVEETGAAQYLRDARILPIYEGTNGIQAIDLVTRKLPLDGGAVVAAYLADLRALVTDADRTAVPEIATLSAAVARAVDDLGATTALLLDAHRDGRTSDLLAAATPYQRLFGLAAGAAYHLKAVTVDRRDGRNSPVAERRLVVARFFITDMLPETAALRLAIAAGGAAIDAATPELMSA